uniref:EF-hand domain-containing protein n=1 Tax=Rhodosorus marinus TaxID=101924 RepID=A0A7S3A1G0_9RHOD|mmetsp:Transcript_38632/g.152531  ORF Transcript_38632/g.152531 Transcript_38632/m.152531 type:complete len:528 (+) Transcript_38632:282-1865(+)|eukprot:CAMPEP_0113958310 /NCGR_PEP_ID=MMETSP0011_2-20120614/3319_1 /TAXON_ID=101924 /ORGANISM="Rhodosorus marinus" /LENGTH=527 /DNA_ID=CAMNT_0000969099 /DNA_START=185 /DNA_END=1768 /DNA_ORIENTATION=+ /assembly_acc=CAM_ASM_000156
MLSRWLLVWWLAVVFFVLDSRAEIAADGIAKSPEEDDGRSRLFQRFDVDNDGQLSEEEVAEMLKQLERAKTKKGDGEDSVGLHEVWIDGESVQVGESDFQLLFKQLSNLKQTKDPSKDPRMSLQEDIVFVQDLVIILVSATIGGTLASVLKQPPLMGYIFGGMLIGPGCLGLVTELVEMETLASLGIAFLLFSLGTEFSLTELQRAKRVAVFGGLTSMFGVSVLTGTLARATGLVKSLPTAIALGLALSLSSTAIVLQCLPKQDSLPTETADGEITIDDPKARKVVLALLVIQDIMIGLILALLPTLNGTPSEFTKEFMSAFLRLGIFVVLSLIVAEYVLPYALDRLDKSQSQEIFTLGIVGTCLIISYVSERLGLAIELGAFVAGIMMSESKYRDRVEHSVDSIRDVFTSIFFVTIGMMIHFSYFYANFLRMFALLVIIFAVKGFVMTATCYLFGDLPFRASLASGLAISQAGEFTFVVASTGQSLQLFSTSETRMINGATALSMLLTPFLITYMRRFGRSIATAK